MRKVQVSVLDGCNVGKLKEFINRIFQRNGLTPVAAAEHLSADWHVEVVKGVRLAVIAPFLAEIRSKINAAL